MFGMNIRMMMMIFADRVKMDIRIVIVMLRLVIWMVKMSRLNVHDLSGIL